MRPGLLSVVVPGPQAPNGPHEKKLAFHRAGPQTRILQLVVLCSHPVTSPISHAEIEQGQKPDGSGSGPICAWEPGTGRGPLWSIRSWEELGEAGVA